MIQIYYLARYFFLGFTNPGVELGYYTGAYRIILLFTLIPGFFYSIFLPDWQKLRLIILRTSILNSIIGVLISMAVIFVGCFRIFLVCSNY